MSRFSLHPILPVLKTPAGFRFVIGPIDGETGKPVHVDKVTGSKPELFFHHTLRGGLCILRLQVLGFGQPGNEVLVPGDHGFC